MSVKEREVGMWYEGEKRNRANELFEGWEELRLFHQEDGGIQST